MFKYFIKYKEVNKQNFQNKVGDYITVLSGDTVSSTLFNSFFAEYEARVTNKDNNKLINRNNPMELNEHLKEVMNKVKLEDRIVDFDGMEYYAVGMGFVPKMRKGEKQPNSLIELIEIIKQRDFAEKDKTEKLVFTTLEKELTSEKQQGHLSTRHKKPAPMYLDEAIAEIGIKNNKNKPSLDIVINKQFPNALQLIALATEYGHNKYLAKDELYDNFRNVEGGSQTYFDAAARHNTDRNGVDNESGLPHIIHASWDFLAGLELWAEENNIDIKDFSENYMKNLNLENAK